MLGKFSRDLGIDLGTANTLVYRKGKGIIVREPSVVAIDMATKKVLAVGNEAKKMIGKTSKGISVIRPMKEGVIADYEITASMLKYYMHHAEMKGNFFTQKPSVVICVPSGVTSVEKRAVTDAAKQAGAKDAFVIEEPLAAAIGAGLPVGEPTGNMVVDIGGGTTEVAVISLGGVVSCISVRRAGDDMDEAIALYVRNQYGVLIGEQTAEQLKIELGAADMSLANQVLDVRGRDLLTGLPKIIQVKGEDVANAIHEVIEAVVNAVKNTLEKTPPELAADIIERGIVLTGGGALLKNMDAVISEETQIPVWLAEEPLDCVAIGTGQALAYTSSFQTTNTGKN